MTVAQRGYAFAFSGTIFVTLYVLTFSKLAETLPVGVATFLLLLSALLLNSIMLLVKKSKNWAKKAKSEFTVASAAQLVLIAISSILGNQFVFLSYEHISPALTNIMQRTELLFVIVLGALLFAERITYHVVIAALLVVMGIIIINYHPSMFEIGHWFGPIFAILAGVSFAIMIVMIRYSSHYFSVTLINQYRLLIAVVILAAVPGVLQRLYSVNLEEVMYAFLAAFGGPFISRLCYIRAVAYLPVASISLIGTSSPVLTLLAMMVIYNIYPTFNQLIGGAMVLFAVVFLVLSKPEKLPNVKTKAELT